MMITERDLTELGMSDAEIDELKESAAAYDAGDWPEGAVVRVGRPSIDTEPVRPVPFRLGVTKLAKLDAKAKSRGVSRSEAMREAVDLWIATA